MPRPKRGLTIEGRKSMAGRLFILPFSIGFLLFFLIPAAQSIWFSFNDVKADLSTTFVGLDNFANIFLKNPDYNKTLVGTLVDTLLEVPVVLIASLFFALILNQRFHGRTVVRAIFFLPVIIASGVVMDIIKNDSFATSLITASEGMEQTVSATSFGLQELLISMGLPQGVVDFFTGISGNLFDLMWRTGIQMIIFLAALQTISPSLYEASAIEGASAWENFWMVTIPMIVPMIMVNLVYTIVDTFTNGTNEFMTMVTNEYRELRYHMMSAMSWAYFLIIGLVLALVLLLFSRLDKGRGKRGDGA